MNPFGMNNPYLQSPMFPPAFYGSGFMLGSFNMTNPYLSSMTNPYLSGANASFPVGYAPNLSPAGVDVNPAGGQVQDGGGQPANGFAQNQQTQPSLTQTLNQLLGGVQKLQTQGPGGKQTALDPKMLQQLRFAPNLSSKANAELLQKLGNWPAALEGPAFQSAFQSLSRLVPQALREAADGKVGKGTLKDISAVADQLRNQLALSVQNLPPARFTEAERYLSNFDDLLRLLRQDPPPFRGKTLQELMKFMEDQGLQLAPPASGNEEAYEELQKALTGLTGGKNQGNARGGKTGY
jgi:hypothetical protein